MKLYTDKKLLNEITDSFSLGIVPVGDSKQVILWARNDASPRVTGYLKNLLFEVTCLDPLNDAPIVSEKIDILEAPKDMAPQAVAKLILEWTPNVDLEQGLKAILTITGQKIVG